MELHKIEQRLLELGPKTHAKVTDLTGTGDHIEAVVVSSAFQDMGRMERQRLVMDLFQSEMATGEIHALTLKTLTPDEYAAKSSR